MHIYNNTFYNKLMGVQILPKSQLSDEKINTSKKYDGIKNV